MKRTVKQSTGYKSQKSSDIDMDCSCEILYDDSLSGVSDGDCDCSQCLQANLNAFNELKNQNVNTLNSTKEISNNRHRQGSSATKIKKPNEASAGRKQENVKKYKSTDRLAESKSKKTKKWGARAENQQGSYDNFGQFVEQGQFSNGQLGDFLLITKHRTRKYLQQRKRLSQNQNAQKQQLRDKIKKNLEMLKYTAQMMRKEKESREDNKGGLLHLYKWNHSEYRCECNGEVDAKKARDNCCRKSCRKLKAKTLLDTNLGKINPDFIENRDQIINSLRKKKQEALAQKQRQKCPDMCPNHHNRTTKDKIQKIEQFIRENVAKHHKKQKKEKEKEGQRQRVLQAKLNAIDIKSKQIVQRSKKYDDNVSKTSFRNSVDQFDTFSELREQNERRKKTKQDNRALKSNPKMREELLEKVYEDVEQDWELDAKKYKNEKFLTKQEVPELRKDEKIYERIAYDAGIKAPKNISKKAQTKQEGHQSKYQTNKKTKSKANLDRKKEEEEKKRIQQEIQRKKKQLMQQFKKRNSNNPQNHQLRQKYQQKLEKTKSPQHDAPQRDLPGKDPYRTNYQTKAGKNSGQVQVHGDPLLQQFTHHRDKERATGRQGQDMGIFTSNIHGLTQKKKLGP